MYTKGAHNLQNQEIMKDNKTRQIAILERILSYAEFKKKHLPMFELLADKLKKLKDEKI